MAVRPHLLWSSETKEEIYTYLYASTHLVGHSRSAISSSQRTFCHLCDFGVISVGIHMARERRKLAQNGRLEGPFGVGLRVLRTGFSVNVAFMTLCRLISCKPMYTHVDHPFVEQHNDLFSETTISKGNFNRTLWWATMLIRLHTGGTSERRQRSIYFCSRKLLVWKTLVPHCATQRPSPKS